MTAPTPPIRRRWPIIVGVLAVLAIVAIVVAIVLTRNPGAIPTATPTTPSTTASMPTAEAAPTGCLGGTGRDVAMLLAAQAAAPHTTTGAIEVAAAFIRWTFRYPTPSDSEADEVGQAVISATATAEFRDLRGAIARNPNPSGGAVPDGTPFYLSTEPGAWYLESDSPDDVVVALGGGYVIDGTLNPQLRSSSTFQLVWEGGVWKVKSGSITRTAEELFRIGTTFTGGC